MESDKSLTNLLLITIFETIAIRSTTKRTEKKRSEGETAESDLLASKLVSYFKIEDCLIVAKMMMKNKKTGTIYVVVKYNLYYLAEFMFSHLQFHFISLKICVYERVDSGSFKRLITPETEPN